MLLTRYANALLALLDFKKQPRHRRHILYKSLVKCWKIPVKEVREDKYSMETKKGKKESKGK